MDNSVLELIKAQYKNDTQCMQNHIDLYFDELEALKRRKMRKILEQQYYLETLGDFMKNMKKIEEKNHKKKKIVTAKAHNNQYCFITINPKPTVKLVDFQKKMEKLVNRSIFTGGMYVLEQRGDTKETAGKGFHCHMLCTRNLDYKPFKVASCIKNTCKTLCNVKDSRLCNIQHIGDEFYIDKREYILGHNKTGENKSKKQDIDIYWRKKNNLSQYYKDAKNT